MAAVTKEIIESGKRYAIIDVKAGLVRRVEIAPLTLDADGKAENVTINIPNGHIAVEAPVSLGTVANRPVKGIPSFELAIKDAATAAKKEASAAAKKAASTAGAQDNPDAS